MTNSTAVDSQLVVWLDGQSGASAASQKSLARKQVATNASPITHTDEEWKNWHAKTYIIADERLRAIIPEGNVELGQPIHIPLQLTGGKVFDILAGQSDSDAKQGETNKINGVEVGNGHARIVSLNDHSVVIEIIPLRPGEVDLAISVLFEDGATATQNYKLHVALSDKGLKTFRLFRGTDAVGLYVGTVDPNYGQFELAPELIYEHLDLPILLNSGKGFKVTVDQPQDNPVISDIDEYGIFHALRPGTAVIHSQIGKVKSVLTVEVDDKDKARQEGLEVK